MSRRSGMFPAVVCVSAGMAVSAYAGVTASPKVSVSSKGISMNGTTIRETGARISNQKVHTFANSPLVLVTWTETSRTGKTAFMAISRTGAGFDQVRDLDMTLRLNYASFDPLVSTPFVPPALRADAANELYIVQFNTIPFEEVQNLVRATGATIEASLPDSALLVRMNAATKAAVGQLELVRWIGVLEPAYKLTQEVRNDILNAAPESVGMRYSISCLRQGPAQQEAVAQFIRDMGGIVEGLTPDMNRMEATLTPEQVLAVARRNEVGGIDPWGGPGGTDMDIVRQIGGAVTVLEPAGFLGQGVRGEVHDTETQSTHPEWNSPNIYVQHGPNGSSGFHGSACYGINFAAGVNPAAKGMLPQREAGIFFWYTRSSQFTAGQPSRLSWNTEAVDPAGAFRSVFQTSSVGSTQITNYSTISQEVDTYLFQIDYLSCQSQSNTNNMTSRPQAWAKNIVSVGGVNHQNTLARGDDLWGGASFGPAQDGRVKPDVWHFYDQTFTTNNASGYTTFSGTSNATPVTAGHFGLIFQMWHQGVWSGFGGGASVFASRPFSTTAKALMCNGAYKYPITATNTRMRQGWGMADVGYLYNIRNKTFIVNANQPVVQGQTHTYQVNVAAAEPELRVTMCYIDPPPTVLTNPNRVNDLSLRVTSPGGTQYWGNVGLSADNISDAGGVANTVDTVENVLLTNPQAGTWTIEVIGSSVTVDAYPTGAVGVTPTGAVDAGFSLVVTGATATAPGPSCYANCDQSTTVPFLNVNDFICFQNRFAAGDTRANCDNSTIPPVLNVNDFSCFNNAFAAGCSAP
ncbi:MAG: S8 family serine peptidase [Phycisphaerae bacterium]|nr:S8 family serine peptidase [Phycisphaerae bacterium]